MGRVGGRPRPSYNMMKGLQKWFGFNSLVLFTFFVLIPLGNPGTKGSPFRWFYFMYTNMGLSFYEFFGGLMLFSAFFTFIWWIVYR